MAVLLQVETMTTDWAEVLVQCGVMTASELCTRSHADLAQILADG